MFEDALWKEQLTATAGGGGWGGRDLVGHHASSIHTPTFPLPPSTSHCSFYSALLELDAVGPKAYVHCSVGLNINDQRLKLGPGLQPSTQLPRDGALCMAAYLRGDPWHPVILTPPPLTDRA